MTCTMKNAQEKLDKLRTGLSAPIAPELLRAGSCFARWLSAAALLGDGGGIETKIIRSTAAPESEKSAPSPAPVGDDAYGHVRVRLDWRYPHAGASALPSKLTATGLKGRSDDAERTDDAEMLVHEEAGPGFRRPALGSATVQDAASRGTATHALLQHMDLSRAADEQGVHAELERLSASGILTRVQAQAADIRSVMRFGASALCRRLLSAQEMRREFRFTLLAEASDYFDAPAGERLLLQGVVDCFIVEDGHITVIDYKTDRVSAAEAAERAQVYAGQLNAYAAALERIRKLPVSQKLVYFLTPGICCEV